MKQIRKNVFETNSSSTHSITISGKKDSYYFPSTDIVVEFGEYGWEQETYRSFMSKLSYVFTMIQYHLDITWNDSRLNEENIYNTVINSKYYQWLQEMFFDNCRRTITVNKNSGSSYNPIGYIDHQSTDVLDDWWSDDEKEFKENMKEFIFNENYGFVTDNDNH